MGGWEGSAGVITHHHLQRAVRGKARPALDVAVVVRRRQDEGRRLGETVDVITRTAHYDSSTTSGAGYNDIRYVFYGCQSRVAMS
jgi:hypothetical protein